MTDGYARETVAWPDLVLRPEVELFMAQQLAAGAQTRDDERDLEKLLRTAAAQIKREVIGSGQYGVQWSDPDTFEPPATDLSAVVARPTYSARILRAPGR